MLFRSLTLAFMFSLVLIPALLLLGTAGWFYLRWKMKQWQQAMAAQMAQAQDVAGGEDGGEVIEGEAVVVREGKDVLLVETVTVSSAAKADDDHPGSAA